MSPERSIRKIPIVANGEVADNLRIVRNFSVRKQPQFPGS